MTTSQPGEQTPEPRQPQQQFPTTPGVPPVLGQPGQPGYPPPQFGWAPAPTGPGAPAAWVTAAPAPARRHRARTALFAVAGAAVVAGLASWGTVLVTDHHTDPSSTTTSASASTASHSTAKGKGGDRIEGTLTGQSGDTWTVTTKAGQHVTVDIGSATKYGTKAHPSSVSAVHTGASLRVAGVDKNGVVEARRVVVVPTT